ncbi:MAG: hypothetical protein E5299_01885 [Burkholderia gladioli]|nr:MAG: hypothetical protein E5299_01885 [Burkholderia gladioli]
MPVNAIVPSRSIDATTPNNRLLRYRGTDLRGEAIPDMVSIHVWPPEGNDDFRLGHLESDLIKGADNKSSVAVLV